MASTLPPRASTGDKPIFIPPKRRNASGKTVNTPTRSIYGDQILNVQGRNPGSVDCLLEHEDAVGSLEKMLNGSMGTMKSTRSSKSNGSITTIERVKREESSHNIGSFSHTSSGQISERSTDIDLVRDAVHTKRNLKDRAVRRSDSRQSRSTTRSSQPSVHTSIDNIEQDQVSVVAAEERGGRAGGGIQSRPLPQPPTPNKTEQQQQDLETPKLKLRINPEDEAIEIVNSENVSVVGARNVSLKQESETNGEKSLLVPKSEGGTLTLIGTVKRGNNKGECFDVQLKISQEKLLQSPKKSRCCCGCCRGPHVLLISMLLLPFSWLLSILYAFYMGTISWYNVFIYFNEQKSCCHTIFVSPIILLLYPVWILPVALLLGTYSGWTILSWDCTTLRQKLSDPERGFYGWICNKVGLPDCSPYQVVVLSALPQDPLTFTSIV